MGLHRASYLIVLMISLLCVGCERQEERRLRIAHLTDPHLFDLAGKNVPHPPPDEGCLNFDLLNYTLAKINIENAAAPIDVVVVTGDIGVEKLIERAINKSCANVVMTRSQDGTLLFDNLDYAQNINAAFEEGAQKFADVLKKSTVKNWLFVNGNNDLCNEEAISIGLFNEFMNHLQNAMVGSNVTVHNLIDDDDYVGTYAPDNSDQVFIGFENGSWKNGQTGALAAKNYDFQKRVLDNLQAEVIKQESAGKVVHLVFHIPDFDDPFNASTSDDACDERRPTTVTFNQDCTAMVPKIPTNLPAHPYSAWLVRDDFRAQWETLVERDSVKMLLAGHFHIAKRDYYSDLALWQTELYLSLPKYNVAAPISIKNQILDDTISQARGFSLVEVGKLTPATVRRFSADQLAHYTCPGDVETTPWEE